MLLVVLLLVGFCFASGERFFVEAPFERVLEKAKASRVIYLGESHTSERDHRIQLKVLRWLREQGIDFVILMEAFQIPFQEYLDDYLEGHIDEGEMIRLTEYKRRWRFDTKLYAPIWRFSREEGIPLYALNVPSELVREVRKKRLAQTKSHYIPPKEVYPPKEYEDFLMDTLGEHKKKINRERFLRIQSLWDNGMAYRILKVMVANPDKRLVVIVGKGHLYKGYGIPYVLSRWVKVSQSVLYPTREGFYLLFSIERSRDSSSDSSIREPN